MLEEIANLGVTQAQYEKMLKFGESVRELNTNHGGLREKDLPLIVNGFKEDYDGLVVVYAQVNTGEDIKAAQIIDENGHVIEAALHVPTDEVGLSGKTNEFSMLEQMIHIGGANSENWFTQGEGSGDFIVE